MRKAWLLIPTLIGGLSAPASAQAHDEWEVNIAPLYFWAASTSGTLAAAGQTLPVSMDFSQAAKNLAGAFTFHVDARSRRWGVLADLNYFKLSTGTTYQLPAGISVTGNLDYAATAFEGGVTYRVANEFSIIGGARTYTVSPTISITGPLATNAINPSKTDIDGFVGFTYRPRLTSNGKLVLLTRGDIGAGQAKFEWKASAGLEYRYKPWGGAMVGYGAFGIDSSQTTMPLGGTPQVTSYDLTQYGPVLSLLFHWGR
jgi:hypothetical protein